MVAPRPTPMTPANQLLTSIDNTGETEYSFDANGNQQSVVDSAGGRTTWIWDYENQPTAMVLASGARETYAYNADSLRVMRSD